MKKTALIIFTVFFSFSSFAYTNDTIGNNNNAETVNNEVSAYFKKFGFEISNKNHFPLYEQIYKLKDIPYKYSGRSQSGLDCSGFTICVFDSVFNEKLSGGSKDIFLKTKTIPDRKLKEGDLLFFKIRGNNISHVGIYLGNGKFAHTTTQAGVMVNDLSDPYYKKYYYKATRVLFNETDDNDMAE